MTNEATGAPRLCGTCHNVVKEEMPTCASCGGKRPRAGWSADRRLGQKLFGNIHISRRLGHGASGSIYLAEDPDTGDQIAVKLLHPELTRDPELVKRFKVEAVVTKSLNIPQIVKTFDFGTLDEDIGTSHYLTMEYVQGQSLDRVIAHHGAFTLDNALEVVRQILIALEVAHQKGVVHRDMKPGNIILTKDEEGRPLVKILDFGFAKVVADEQQGFMSMAKVTRGNVVLGTPMYMSPEQARGAKEIDGRTDIYSVGVLFYRMVAGVPPIEADNPMDLIARQISEVPPPPSSHRHTVPRDLDRIIMKMLAKDPDDRQDSAAEVLDELNREYPTGASRWNLDEMVSEAADPAGLLADVGQYVEDEEELKALVAPDSSVGLYLMFGGGALLLLAVVLFFVLR